MSPLNSLVFSRPVFSVMIKTILMIILVVFVNGVRAQLTDLSAAINQLSSSNDPLQQSLGESIRHLAFDEVATAYVVNATPSFPEEGSALVVNLHGSDLSTLDLGSPELQEVQMVRITVTNESDLAGLSGLLLLNTSAKLLVICELDITPTALAQAIGNVNERQIYYSISVPR